MTPGLYTEEQVKQILRLANSTIDASLAVANAEIERLVRSATDLLQCLARGCAQDAPCYKEHIDTLRADLASPQPDVVAASAEHMDRAQWLWDNLPLRQHENKAQWLKVAASVSVAAHQAGVRAGREEERERCLRVLKLNNDNDAHRYYIEHPEFFPHRPLTPDPKL